jgi:hypothetical protein
MKRLAMAVVALTALAVAAEAGSPFEPVKLVDRIGVYHYTHYVRGPAKGKKHGGSQSTTAEARATSPAKPSPKPTPQPARADD